MQEIPEATKFRTTGLAHAMKVKILFRDITATGEGSWAPSTRLVPNDIGAIDGNDVMLDQNDNVVEGLDALDDESNLNTHSIDDIPTDLDMQDNGNKKVGLTVQCKKRKKGVQIVSQCLSRICDVIESINTLTSKNYDKLGCSIEEVMNVVRGLLKEKMTLTSLSVQPRYFLRYHIERCL
jgi:hypothetical protein